MVKWRDIELPGFAAPLAAVGAERRDALMAHLRRILPSSYARYPQTRMRKPQQPAHDADACRACRGFCCRNGGDIGFLTDEALRMVWSEQPQRSKDELIAAYTDRVPEMAVAGSCIFHAANGCALPGELRSVVCKTYLCDPLKHAGAAPDQSTRSTPNT